MHVRCTHCGLDVEAPDGSLGKSLRCPKCSGIFECALPTAAVVVEEDEPTGPAEELLLEDEVPAEPAEGEPMELSDELDEGPTLEDLSRAVTPSDALSHLSGDRPKQVMKESPRQWYILVSGVAAVAMTYEDLKRKARIAAIKPKTKIYYAPEDLTIAARAIPGLFPAEDAKKAEAAKGKYYPKPAADADATAKDAAAALGTLGGTGDQVQGADALSALTPDEKAGAIEADEALSRMGAGEDADIAAAAAEALGKLGSDAAEPSSADAAEAPGELDAQAEQDSHERQGAG